MSLEVICGLGAMTYIHFSFLHYYKDIVYYNHYNVTITTKMAYCSKMLVCTRILKI